MSWVWETLTAAVWGYYLLPGETEWDDEDEEGEEVTHTAFGDPMGDEMSDEAWWGHRSRLDAALGARRLAEFDIEPDGDCQFGAIAHQAFGSTRRATGWWVRATVVSFLLSPGPMAHYAPFFPGGAGAYLAHVKDLSRHGVWGDHLTLSAAAALWNVSITVISSQEGGGEELTLEPPPPLLRAQLLGLDPEDCEAARSWPRVWVLSHIAEEHFNSVLTWPELVQIRTTGVLDGWNDPSLGPRPSALPALIEYVYNPDDFGVLPDRDAGLSMDAVAYRLEQERGESGSQCFLM